MDALVHYAFPTAITRLFAFDHRLLRRASTHPVSDFQVQAFQLMKDVSVTFISFNAHKYPL